MDSQCELTMILCDVFIWNEGWTRCRNGCLTETLLRVASVNKTSRFENKRTDLGCESSNFSSYRGSTKARSRADEWKPPPWTRDWFCFRGLTRPRP